MFEGPAILPETPLPEPSDTATPASEIVRASREARHPAGFFAVKRAADILISLLLLPLVAGSCVILLLLNPVFNRGPVFFVQTRMGLRCHPIRVVKFRTMRPVPSVVRGPEAPLESDRITALGHWLRITRLDEVPQILNVLKGDMSLVGPRPDFIDHAEAYLETVPGYRERHMVRPGISGLAQVTLGYAEGTDATAAKTRADLHYILHSGWRLEAWIVWQTLRTILLCRGT